LPSDKEGDMAIVIKTIRGRAYLYRQRSTRVGGKVVTKSTYIGPVGGTVRRRKGVLGRIGEFITINLQHGHIFDIASFAREEQEREQQKAAKTAAGLASLHEQYGLTLGPRTPVPIDKPMRNDAFLNAQPSTEQPSAEQPSADQSSTGQQDAPPDVSDGAESQ
jgi:hypothetical protein